MEKRLKEILERLSAIGTSVIEKRDSIDDLSLEEIALLESEINSLDEERTALEKEKSEIELRMQEANDILKNKSGKEIEKKGEKKMNEKELRASELYRSAFFKAIAKEELTQEERAAIVSTETGLALPVSTEKSIWDAVHEQHPILNDIKLFETGTILEISVHTATSAATKKATEGAVVPDATNTFVKVKLVGNDFAKVVRLSFAAAKMTAGALEAYLVSEIAAGVGDALAENVFLTLKTQTIAGNQVVNAAPDYAALVGIMGACKRVNNLTIYCSNQVKYTKILSLVDTNKQPIFRDGVALGAEVKVDSATGNDIYVLDPQKFVGNMVQPILIDTDKDITSQTIIHAGYCRFEGALTDTSSCAIIKAA